VLAEFASPGLSRIQAFLLPHAVPLVRPRIIKMYGVDARRAAEALETTRAVFAEAAAALGSGQWLVGDRMTAADIAFASLAAPLLGPEGHPATRLALDMVGAPLRAIVEELRATPAGAHATRLYRSHRGRRSIR
jgi:glutathione S-transferase